MARNRKVRGGPGDGRVGRPSRRGGGGWQVDRIHLSEAPICPDVRTPDLADVLDAMKAVPRPDDWPAVRELVVPMIPRVRAQPPGYPDPLRRLVPPGILIGVGIDLGPALASVSVDQCTVLGITTDELIAQSLANLVARAEDVPPGAVHRDRLDGVSVAALQTGRSIGSTLVLAPDQLRRMFGPQPALYVAPMRDLLLGLPADVELELAAWLYWEIARQDPNHLPPIGFRFDGERVVTAPFGGLDTRLLASDPGAWPIESGRSTEARASHARPSNGSAARSAVPVATGG